MTNWKLFHRLWSKAKDGPNYNKAQWRALEQVLLASRLREVPAQDPCGKTLED